MARLNGNLEDLATGDGPICSADPAQKISTYEERSWAKKKKIIMKRISKPIPELVPHQSFWRSEQLRKARSAKASHRTA